jgi:hypothetical protein
MNKKVNQDFEIYGKMVDEEDEKLCLRDLSVQN